MEQDVNLTIHIHEDEKTTLAYTELDLRGDHFEASGKASRNPIDRPMPVVGEELAMARALSDLSHQVMESARVKIEQFLED